MPGARDSFELGVKSLEGLAANFYAKDAIAAEAFRTAVRNGVEEMYGLAYLFCPVDTEFMRLHLKQKQTDLTWEVGWDATDFFDAGLAFYPEYVEFGTRHMRGQFVLTRAYEEVQPKMADDIGNAIKEALDRRST